MREEYHRNPQQVEFLMAKKKARRPRTEMQFRQTVILQDLMAGFPIYKICEKHDLSRATVERVREQHAEKIREALAELVARRQEKINEFLEQETNDLIKIARETSMQLREALERHAKKIAQGKNVAKEIRQRQDGKLVKAVPSDDIEVAAAVWEKVHNVLNKFQGDVK